MTPRWAGTGRLAAPWPEPLAPALQLSDAIPDGLLPKRPTPPDFRYVAAAGSAPASGGHKYRAYGGPHGSGQLHAALRGW
jgi:hypothetical protein